MKKLEELEARLDPLLTDIDTLKSAASRLVAEGNDNAINIVGEVNNHWTVFKLKVIAVLFLTELLDSSS